ncbi:MAG TPA: hypothetical protein VNT25_08095, partial [Allosphingosinicella sp.]|nr:hypothetical protein [Allosphingosinicella sp.]
MVTRTSAKIHKWLALILTLPILFWFASGLFFAIAPIEKVRSEHMKSEAMPAPVELGAAGAGLSRLAGMGVGSAHKVEIRTVLGRPVALVAAGEGRPRLYDLA